MSVKFNGWREGFLLYLPWWLGAAVLLTNTSSLIYHWLGFLFFIIGITIFLFFRDPPRRVQTDENEIVAPADGRVVEITKLSSCSFYDQPCVRISIFLSIFNVHINRAPFGGKVTNIMYNPGSFFDARSKKATDLNEFLVLTISTQYGEIAVRQVAGLIARRIVCKARISDIICKGQKYGMIRFGSRTELYLPENVTILIREGQKVKAGKSIVAKFETGKDGKDYVKQA